MEQQGQSSSRGSRGVVSLLQAALGSHVPAVLF